MNLQIRSPVRNYSIKHFKTEKFKTQNLIKL
jgi:hypothetical protein